MHQDSSLVFLKLYRNTNCTDFSRVCKSQLQSPIHGIFWFWVYSSHKIQWQTNHFASCQVDIFHFSFQSTSIVLFPLKTRIKKQQIIFKGAVCQVRCQCILNEVMNVLTLLLKCCEIIIVQHLTFSWFCLFPTALLLHLFSVPSHCDSLYWYCISCCQLPLYLSSVVIWLGFPGLTSGFRF